MRLNKQYRWFRELTSTIYNLLIRSLFDLRVADVNCALKLFPRRLFDRIAITSHHGFIDAEILLQARRLSLSISQVAVTHFPRTEGVSAAGKPAVIFFTWLETMQFWIHHRSEKQLLSPNSDDATMVPKPESIMSRQIQLSEKQTAPARHQKLPYS